MNQEPMNAREEPAAPTPADTPEKSPRSLSAVLFDYVELFAWALFVVMIVFTFLFRICRVDGQSMENTLYENQMLLLRSAFYKPEQDDIVVFHLTDSDNNMEKTLVKRVIALGGQDVMIDTNTATITVDGVVYEDSHSVLKNRSTDAITDQYEVWGLFFDHFDSATGVYRATVPEGCVFVMGDNRNNSKDSRNPTVGFVDERCILGGVVLRLRPFTVFH